MPMCLVIEVSWVEIGNNSSPTLSRLATTVVFVVAIVAAQQFIHNFIH